MQQRFTRHEDYDTNFERIREEKNILFLIIKYFSCTTLKFTNCDTKYDYFFR